MVSAISKHERYAGRIKCWASDVGINQGNEHSFDHELDDKKNEIHVYYLPLQIQLSDFVRDTRMGKKIFLNRWRGYGM